MIKIGTPKKLDISLEKLISLALSINKNTIANKSKTKEEKIPTDKFIKQFKINRRDFSFTIKDTEIKYNKSTFLYDIPEGLTINNKAMNGGIVPLDPNKQQSNNKVTTEESQQSNNKVTTKESQQSNNKVTTKESQQSNQTVAPVKKEQTLSSNLKNLPVELKKIIDQSSEIEEMLYWYRHHKDDDKIIEVPEIDVTHVDLQGELMVRSFKTYARVLDKFAVFCKSKKEMQKDLIALALVEFMNTYK